jgi:beta-lactamase regulating signal transducer with metallopeptidase domain
MGLTMLARAQTQYRYSWGVACLLAMSLFPLLTLGVIASSQSRPGESPAFTLAEPLPAPVTFDTSEGMPSRPDTTRLSPDSVVAVYVRGTWKAWLITAWAVGVAILSLRLTGAAIFLCWLRRTTLPLVQRLDLHVDRMRRRMRISGHVCVATSANVATAIACGLLRPMVILPANWLTDLSPSMLEAVISHELAHIRRHDLWVNLWQRVMETVLYYHPAVWWVSASIRQEREMCCDELAVAAMQDRVQYAQTLEFLAKGRFAGTAPYWLSTGMGGEEMFLLNRVKRVLGIEIRRASLSHWPAACMVILMAVGVLTLFRDGQPLKADEPAAEQPSQNDLEAAETAIHQGELKRGDGLMKLALADQQAEEDAEGTTNTDENPQAEEDDSQLALDLIDRCAVNEPFGELAP